MDLCRAAEDLLDGKCVTLLFLELKMVWVNSDPRKHVSLQFQDTACLERSTWKFASWCSLALLGISRLEPEPTRGKKKTSLDWKDLALVCLEYRLSLCLRTEWICSSFQCVQIVKFLGFTEVHKITEGSLRNRKHHRSLPSYEWKRGWQMRTNRTKILLGCWCCS